MTERTHIYVVKYNGVEYQRLTAHTTWEAIDRTWNAHATSHMTRQLMTATKI